MGVEEVMGAAVGARLQPFRVDPRPDGVEDRRMVSDGASLGGHTIDLPLQENSMRGTWTMQVYTDPKGTAIAEKTFLVDDFVPDCIEFDMTSEAKEIAARLAVLETKLDDEYIKSVPPFKPTMFAGRKDPGGNRVVMMELFTGAQCPPCVAADVAFDALLKSYKPTELVLVQYHMHIPGSDPMTNPDTIARWDYYRKHFAENIRGVPSSLFNGKPVAGGGGDAAMTALVVHNEAALGWIAGSLRALGRRVPDDVAVVAICPDELAEQMQLTSVQLPAEELGRQATELLVARLNGHPTAPLTLLPPKLSGRASTAPRLRRA